MPLLRLYVTAVQSLIAALSACVPLALAAVPLTLVPYAVGTSLGTGFGVLAFVLGVPLSCWALPLLAGPERSNLERTSNLVP